MLLRSLAVAVILFTCSLCLAQGGGSSELSIGYERFELSGDNQALGDASGLGIRTGLSAPLVPFDVPELRLNLGFGAAFLSGDAEEADNDGDGELEDVEDPELIVLRLEMGPSWRQIFGNFFIEPGVKGALLMGRLDEVPGGSQWKGGWGIKPDLRLGWQTRGHLQLGLEAHYMYGYLKFRDGIGGDFDNFYFGGFLGFRW